MPDVALLSRLSFTERAALRRLSQETGFSEADIAEEMVVGYIRLLLDAPAALPDRPLLGMVRRLEARPRG